MKNISDKTKKWFTIIACLIICAVLVVIINDQFRPAPKVQVDIPAASSSSSEVSVSAVEIKPQEEEKVASEAASPASSEPEISDAPDTHESSAPAESQAIQLAPEKPEYSQEQLTDPDIKPNGEAVTDQDIADEEAETPESSGAEHWQGDPQGGQKKDAKIYVPGFGWIEDIGEGSGSYAADMYENGNKVGIM